MKKFILLTCAFIMALSLNAQVETPQPSPRANLKQKVGLTNFTIDYSRPGVKGRTIFGDLEPWGKIWRAGANFNTLISFSDEITFAGTNVKAGTYAIYIKLNSSKQWDVILYSDIDKRGVPQDWDEKKIVAIAKVMVEEVPFVVETFTIDLNNIKDDSADLEFIWEKSYAAVPITVPTDQKVTASIDKTMAGPSIADLYSSAVYYMNAGKDINQAKEWMDSALGMMDKPRFWHLRQKSLIYAAAGDKKGAIEAAKASLADAEASGNAGYVKMNKDSLKEWGAN